jgi:hypothetical protein
MMPLEMFRDLCGVTLTGIGLSELSTIDVKLEALSAYCLLATSRSILPLRNFFAVLTSPTAHFSSFWRPKIDSLIDDCHMVRLQGMMES